MQYKLTIPGRLPGLNELIEAERANRYKGAQLKKDAERRICAEIRRQLHGVHIRRPVVTAAGTGITSPPGASSSRTRWCAARCCKTTAGRRSPALPMTGLWIRRGPG